MVTIPPILVGEISLQDTLRNLDHILSEFSIVECMVVNQHCSLVKILQLTATTSESKPNAVAIKPNFSGIPYTC